MDCLRPCRTEWLCSPRGICKKYFCDGCRRKKCPCSGRTLHLFYAAILLSHQRTFDCPGKGQWGVDGSDKWRGLYGRKVAILGMGNNGRMLADRLQALGMEIYAYDKYPVKGYDYISHKYCGLNGDTLDPILAECDFIVLTLALTDETYHMFDTEAFRKMKSNAVLINMARGGIVDTAALTQALEDGAIGGAGLDVIEEEPFPSDHPLWRMPNVYITPHMTPQVPNRAGRSIEIIRENARRFVAGEPMLNLLKPTDTFQSGNGNSGWARLTQSNLSKEEIAKIPLEKFLGKRGWTDPSEWNYLD
ncbi:D-2-hydroxyacid dehydrogenase [Roseburia sp. AM51-8]|uniref:NAD(P)-dependent oxidoreductase n=1 Tax=Roseburia sp. AM51-8 TaxID=2292366 RepID=UPI000E4CD9F8|nr:NAD(P)-dependent oxidoreductase [Roseburia sp. AM51-8]RHP99007.1 D-2-hydroxyacid dehydrogenase [Roseburia sp. AM51-8]